MSSLLAALKPAKQGLGGGDIVSLTRAATQKTLAAPDPELNADVVDALRKGRASPEATADALRARLRQSNPHKVWLAVELTREVLTKAPEATRHVRSRVLEDVERVASSPMNRYGTDLKGQQNAKTAAFKLVSEYAGGGLLPGGGAAGGGGDGAPVRASGQGRRRRPKPDDDDGPAGSAAAEVGPSAAPHGISRKPQAMRRVTPADRLEQPSSPRATTTAAGSAAASASPRRGGADGAGPPPTANAPAPVPRGRWARVLEAAAAGEATGKRYVSSMCDALMLYAGAAARDGGDSKAAASAEAAATSLAKEMVQFNGALERVVAQVANGGSGSGGARSGNRRDGTGGGFDGPEAEAVTRRCLATTDAVCAALALHEEVMYARRTRQAAAAAEKGRGEGAGAGGLGAAGAAAAGAGAAATTAAEAVDDSDDEDDEGLDELASALEAAVVSPKVAAASEGAPSIPRATSNPFDDFAAAAPAPAAAAAPAAFEDAAIFSAPKEGAPPAPAASADFADLLI